MKSAEKTGLSRSKNVIKIDRFMPILSYLLQLDEPKKFIWLIYRKEIAIFITEFRHHKHFNKQKKVQIGLKWDVT